MKTVLKDAVASALAGVFAGVATLGLADDRVVICAVANTLIVSGFLFGLLRLTTGEVAE